jgi:GNAT superfamily N-acetyltransferase
MEANNEISFCPLESSRFNCSIYRGVLTHIDTAAVKGFIKTNKPDILIIRVPAGFKDEHYKLADTGYQVLHCDTLVYYFCSLHSHSTTPLRNELRFHIVDRETRSLLGGLTGIIFADYKNHYSSNPQLKKELILEGYKEWAESFVHAEDPSKYGWYVTLDQAVVAFALCSITDQNTCEGVLYGVKKEVSGKGIYSDLVRFTQNFFKEKGIRIMKVSTQIQNYSVQKAWIKEGFTLKEAFDTYHINCFLTHQKPGS